MKRMEGNDIIMKSIAGIIWELTEQINFATFFPTNPII